MRFLRLLKILSVAFRFGLDEFFLGHERLRLVRPVVKLATFWRRLDKARLVDGIDDVFAAAPA